MTKENYWGLVAELASIDSALEEIHQELVAAANRIDPQNPDVDLVKSLALTLHHLYTGIEDALLRIAEVVDGGKPSGENWHFSLLRQMAGGIEGLRPPVLRRETLEFLDQLRGFRHLVRHAYQRHYEWRRIAENVQAAMQGWPLFREDLREFQAFLQLMLHGLKREQRRRSPES
ncbi:MAG: hypothetical protein M0Z27_02665 [Thermaerobacter sp.]|nr:hypothetical protein [Thermaerobacter sp.]